MSILKLQQLHKSFGSTQVLRGIDLQVNKGEVIAIIGPSGCGKSTLLRCLNGLEAIDSGTIKFQQQELQIASTNWQQIRQKIGMVFQSYDLFANLNVIENILLAPLKVQNRKRQEAEQQADELLKRIGLYERKLAYPRELSGGQKQRIAIVRALCMNPEIMLFDEVTASLDPEMVREVLEVIQQLAEQGMTMLIVTHEMGFAQRVADQIVFMADGLIVEHSNQPQEFFSNPKTARAKNFLTVLDY